MGWRCPLSTASTGASCVGFSWTGLNTASVVQANDGPQSVHAQAGGPRLCWTNGGDGHSRWRSHSACEDKEVEMDMCFTCGAEREECRRGQRSVPPGGLQAWISPRIAASLPERTPLRRDVAFHNAAGAPPLVHRLRGHPAEDAQSSVQVDGPHRLWYSACLGSSRKRRERPWRSSQ